MRRFLQSAGALVAAAVLVSCGGGSGGGAAPDSPSVAPGNMAAVARLDGNALPDTSPNLAVVADNVHGVYYQASKPHLLDGSSLRVVRIEASGKVTPVAGPWNSDTCGSNWCPEARIATDGVGNLYVFWPAAPITAVPTVYKLDSNGSVLSTLELKDQVPYTTAGSSEVNYRYRFGGGGGAPPMAVDRQGNVSLFDDDGVLWRIGWDGVAKPLAGQKPWGTPQDGTGADARFRFSWAPITADNAGNIYVADGWALRKVTPAGVVTTLPVSGALATGTDAAGNIYLVGEGMCSGKTVSPSGEATPIVFKSSDDAVCRRNTSLAAFAMTPDGVVAVSFDDVITPDFTRTPVSALLVFAAF